MSIEFECPNCQSVLRVGNESAGLRARCPHCQNINQIPNLASAAEPETLPPSQASQIPDGRHESPTMAPQSSFVSSYPSAENASPIHEHYFVDSVTGSTFGPASRDQLDAWVVEGRISKDCMIRTSQGMISASVDYYPDLASPAVAEVSALNGESKTSPNPYTSPIETGAAPPQGPFIEGANDFGEVLVASWNIFRKNLFLLLSTSAIFFLADLLSHLSPSFVISTKSFKFSFNGMMIVAFVLKTFLGIGLTIICLKLCRLQTAKFSDLFGGTNKLLRCLGFFVIGGIAVTLAMLILILPAIILSVIFWPSFYLIVDKDAKLLKSFNMAAMPHTRANFVTSFMVMFFSFGISILTSRFFFFGCSIFGIAFLAVFWSVAYLKITDQEIAEAI